jgi:hypothetical protein
VNLQDLGNIGEFAGAIAVIVSLVYLAWQIRQNTAQLSQNADWLAASASQDVAGSMNEWSYVLARDPDLTAFLFKALADPKALDVGEQYRFFLLASIYLRNYDTALHLSQLGFIPALDSIERSVKAMLGSPQMRDWWKIQGAQFDQAFRDRVDRLLREPAA